MESFCDKNKHGHGENLDEICIASFWNEDPIPDSLIQ